MGMVDRRSAGYLPRLQHEAHDGSYCEVKIPDYGSWNANSQELSDLKSQIQAFHKLRSGRLLWMG